MKRTGFLSYLLALLGGGLGGLLALFFCCEQFAMPDRAQVWRSYHEIILDFVPGPRVLIESGSNTLHAIRTDVLERALNLPVFVIADNASIPLNLKIKRLEKYAKAGDVIVLPLEWEYYRWEMVPSDFLSLLSRRWSHYYFTMPLIERFAFFVRYISFDFIVSEAWTHFSSRAKQNRAMAYTNMMEEKSNWSGVTDNSVETRERHSITKGKTCRTFISVPHEVKDFVLDFADKLVDLEKRRNVKVVVTWPAVAGSDCYTDPEFKNYTEALRAVFTSRGILIAGNPEDSAFSEPHVLDTYYHVDIEAANHRSNRLAEALKSLGLARDHLDRASDALADTALAKEAARVLGGGGEAAAAHISDGEYHVGTDEFEKRFVLLRGWAGVESWGVWNSGPISKLILRPQPDKDCKLLLDASYFADGPPSEVYLNDRTVGVDSRGEIPIARGATSVTLTLIHKQLRSPRQLGLGDDPRQLAFGLKTIRIGCDPVASGVK